MQKSLFCNGKHQAGLFKRGLRVHRSHCCFYLQDKGFQRHRKELREVESVAMGQDVQASEGKVKIHIRLYDLDKRYSNEND